MAKPVISDVLAMRYATSAMAEVWSAESKIRCERQLWLAILEAQAQLGLEISTEDIMAYVVVSDQIDLTSIKKRELTTKQDVKARIEEFNALASQQRGKPLELIHQGLTSRDLTDNVEQWQILQSLHLVRDRTVAILQRLGKKSLEYIHLDICGRTHNVPAQVITLGKRLANYAEELLLAFDHLEYLLDNYPLRGIKGPTGTQQDMAALLGQRAVSLEDVVSVHLDFEEVFNCVGQVYPRSLDFEVLSILVQLASAPGNFAKMIRLMAGNELAHEGFKEGQTGSAGMPHKMNSRTCERINSLVIVLGGFQEMVKGLVGDQWNEGDVSCSVVRRVALPQAFFAMDGIFESTLTVLDEMEVFPGMIKRELELYLPFLSSTKLLMEALKQGGGRETVHATIKKHAVAAIKSVRAGGENTFIESLAAASTASTFPLKLDRILELTSRPDHGLAENQVKQICSRIREITKRFPDEVVHYQPEPLL